MKVDQVKAGTLLSYVQNVLTLIVSVIYTPVMIRCLGQSEYGLYQTAASVISVLSLLSLGFNSGYIRYYSKYKKDGDVLSIERLNGLFLLLFSVIGLISLACGAVIVPNLSLIFDQGLTEAEYHIARILLILLIANLSISFPAGVFSTIISAHERFVFLKLVGMIKTVLGPLVTLPVLLLGYRSVALVVVSLVSSLFADLLYLYYVLFVLRCKFRFSGFEKGLFAGLFAYTGFIAINMIVDQVNNHVDKVLLGRFCGTAAVSIYAVGSTLYTYYLSISTSVSSAFTPRVHHLYQRYHDTDRAVFREEITTLFIKVGRIQYLFLALLATGFVFFGKPFIRYWAGEEYALSYYITLLLMLPVTVPLIQNIGIEVQRAENLHRFRSLVYLLMATLNVGVSVLLIRRYGAIGAPIGTALSLLLANGLIMNVYYQKKCDLDVFRFWKNILRLSLGLLLPVACACVFVRFVPIDSIVKLILSICVYTVIFALSMWFFGMNAYEKDLTRRVIARALALIRKNKETPAERR